jgi:hypothetical protein
VYSNLGVNSGRGINVSGAFAEAYDNTVYGNRTGMQVNNGAVARNNRVYGNLDVGVRISGAGQMYDNIIYSNPVGVHV